MSEYEEALCAICARHDAMMKMVNGHRSSVMTDCAISEIYCDCVQTVMELRGFKRHAGFYYTHHTVDGHIVIMGLWSKT